MWVIDNSSLIQESPGLKPDWFFEIRLFADKIVKHFVKDESFKSFTMTFNILFVTYFWETSLKIISNGAQIESSHIFRM